MAQFNAQRKQLMVITRTSFDWRIYRQGPTHRYFVRVVSAARVLTIIDSWPASAPIKLRAAK